MASRSGASMRSHFWKHWTRMPRTFLPGTFKMYFHGSRTDWRAGTRADRGVRVQQSAAVRAPDAAAVWACVGHRRRGRSRGTHLVYFVQRRPPAPFFLGKFAKLGHELVRSLVTRTGLALLSRRRHQFSLPWRPLRCRRTPPLSETPAHKSPRRYTNSNAKVGSHGDAALLPPD